MGRAAVARGGLSSIVGFILVRLLAFIRLSECSRARARDLFTPGFVRPCVKVRSVAVMGGNWWLLVVIGGNFGSKFRLTDFPNSDCFIMCHGWIPFRYAPRDPGGSHVFVGRLAEGVGHP